MKNIIITLLCATVLWATTTMVGVYVVTGSWDASGATHTQPIKKGVASAKPSTCTQGEEYFATDATAGQNEYYCTATNTWTQQTGSGGGSSSGGYLDIPVGGATGGIITGPWYDTLAPYDSGSSGHVPAIQFASNGDVARATVRLPSTWTGTSVSVTLTVVDSGGVTGTVPYTLQIGCYPSGTVGIADPTLGTALSLTGTQTANATLDLTASPLNIPSGCGAGVMARFLVTRGTHGRTGAHGLSDVYLSW